MCGHAVDLAENLTGDGTGCGRVSPGGGMPTSCSRVIASVAPRQETPVSAAAGVHVMCGSVEEGVDDALVGLSPSRVLATPALLTL